MKLAKPLNEYIDHTLLKPGATRTEFETLLDEAIKYQFASVCVPPFMAVAIKKTLEREGSEVKVCTVVDFPHGHLPLALKLTQALALAEAGIHEIDWVLNYANLKNGMFDNVGVEIENMGKQLSDLGAVTKCIIETCYLNEEEKTFMWKALSEHTGVDYIKTSTGFGPEGAQLVDVLNWNALREAEDFGLDSGGLIQLTPIVGPRGSPLKIKAAGGIRDLDTALKFIGCGADRLGMSASVEVMEEYNVRQSTFTEEEETGIQEEYNG